MRTRTARFGLVLFTAVALAGCSSSGTTEPGTDGPETDGPAGESVQVTDAWVKAADSGMTGAFGELENTGDSDVTVVSITSPASTRLELHETVENETGEMVMREKEGGFTIRAAGSLTLEPGGNHIMLMDLVDPVQAGDEVTFTLGFSDGSSLEFTAPAKEFAGAAENYEGDAGEMDMGDE
jgi:hypothetical protein